MFLCHGVGLEGLEQGGPWLLPVTTGRAVLLGYLVAPGVTGLLGLVFFGDRCSCLLWSWSALVGVPGFCRRLAGRLEMH